MAGARAAVKERVMPAMHAAATQRGAMASERVASGA